MFFGVSNPLVIKSGEDTVERADWISKCIKLTGTSRCGVGKLCEVSLDFHPSPSNAFLHCAVGQASPWTVASVLAGADDGMTPSPLSLL